MCSYSVGTLKDLLFSLLSNAQEHISSIFIFARIKLVIRTKFSFWGCYFFGLNSNPQVFTYIV